MAKIPGPMRLRLSAAFQPPEKKSSRLPGASQGGSLDVLVKNDVRLLAYGLRGVGPRFGIQDWRAPVQTPCQIPLHIA